MPAERTGSDKDIVIGINTTDQDSVEVANLNVDALHSNSNSLETGSSVDFRDLDQLTQQDLRAFEKLQAELERLQGTNTQSQISENSNDGGCNSQIYYDSSSAESIQSKIGSDTSTITTASTDSLVCSQTNSQDSSVELVKTSTVKRSLVNSTPVPPVVTKVIITSKNSSNNQPQAIPVHLNQVQGQVVTLSPGVNILPHTSQTPSKITISAHGIASPNKSVTSIMGTPTKSGMPVNKLPISPAKTPTKITMIPVSITKSPQRTVPASSVVTMVTRTVNVAERAALSTNSSAVSTSAKPATITMSPSKFIIKQGNTSKTNESQQLQLSVSKSLQVGAQQSVRQVTGINNPSVQQISVPGSKFHYVRLVTPTTQASTTTVAKAATTVTSVVQARPIVPAAVVSSGSHNASSQKKITLPVQGNQPKSTSSQGSTATVQRFLLPAPSQIAIRSSTSTTGTTNLTQIRPNLSTTTTSNLLPPTAIIPSGNSIPGMQGYALVSATYVTQLQQQQQNNKQGAMTSQLRSDFIPIASNDPVVTANTLARNSINGSAIEATGARPRKPCNCTKSRCLKLYCDCFANGEFCHNCNCTNCANNLGFEELRSKSIKACLERNPTAFHPKIGKGKDGDNDRRHNKGCNCKRSGCLKNYCECYEAKIMCSSICKCVGCKNYEESPERKTLMHLADAAEVRVQQQTAAKTKLSSQISGLPSRPPVSTATGEKLPYTFVTTDVAAASCACLVAQAEESDRLRMPQVIQERMVIEEFGRCLMQVIDAANKTKGDLFTSNSSR